MKNCTPAPVVVVVVVAVVVLVVAVVIVVVVVFVLVHCKLKSLLFSCPDFGLSSGWNIEELSGEFHGLSSFVRRRL